MPSEAEVVFRRELERIAAGEWECGCEAIDSHACDKWEIIHNTRKVLFNHPEPPARVADPAACTHRFTSPWQPGGREVCGEPRESQYHPGGTGLATHAYKPAESDPARGALCAYVYPGGAWRGGKCAAMRGNMVHDTLRNGTGRHAFVEPEP